MKVIECRDKRARVSKVKKLIMSAGNTIGSVHFVKRSDGTLRKMCYRLHARKPGYAAKPTGKRFKSRLEKNIKVNLLTVLDVNKVRRDKKGKICGRGDWRSVPVDTVKRICVKGEIYKIV